MGRGLRAEPRTGSFREAEEPSGGRRSRGKRWERDELADEGMKEAAGGGGGVVGRGGRVKVVRFPSRVFRMTPPTVALPEGVSLGLTTEKSLLGNRPSTDGCLPRRLCTEVLYSGTTGGMVVARTKSGSRASMWLWLSSRPPGLRWESGAGDSLGTCWGRLEGAAEGGWGKDKAGAG